MLIWHLAFSLTTWQTLFNWQHSYNCKMVGSSKVTETLWQEVVRTKVKGMTFSAITREVPNLWFLEYCRLTMTLIHSSPLKRLVVYIRQMNEKTVQYGESQWGIGSALQLELLASTLLNRVWIFQRSRTEAQVRKEVSERWRRKCHDLGDVLFSRRWTSYTAKLKCERNFFIRASCSSMQFLYCKHWSISLQFPWKTILLSHRKTCNSSLTLKTLK